MGKICLDLVSSSLEPCRASGRIYDRLPGDRWYAEIEEGIDYLDAAFPEVDLIVTNPPFSIAAEFLEKSLTEASCVVYLLRLNFLGTKRRAISEISAIALICLVKAPVIHGRRNGCNRICMVLLDGRER
jgi:hypothetical protein